MKSFLYILLFSICFLGYKKRDAKPIAPITSIYEISKILPGKWIVTKFTEIEENDIVLEKTQLFSGYVLSFEQQNKFNVNIDNIKTIGGLWLWQVALLQQNLKKDYFLEIKTNDFKTEKLSKNWNIQGFTYQKENNTIYYTIELNIYGSNKGSKTLVLKNAQKT